MAPGLSRLCAMTPLMSVSLRGLGLRCALRCDQFLRLFADWGQLGVLGDHGLEAFEGARVCGRWRRARCCFVSIPSGAPHSWAHCAAPCVVRDCELLDACLVDLSVCRGRPGCWVPGFWTPGHGTVRVGRVEDEAEPDGWLMAVSPGVLGFGVTSVRRRHARFPSSFCWRAATSPRFRRCWRGSFDVVV